MKLSISTAIFLSVFCGILTMIPANITSYAVLAGSAITNTGIATNITGDMGIFPGTSVSGFSGNAVSGAIQIANNFSLNAQNNLITLYNQLAALPCGVSLTGIDLGGLTLVPAVYCFTSTAAITGTLTLDSQNQTNPQWVFQITSALNTADYSIVRFINGPAPCNVFWNVGSSATLGIGSIFQGVITAYTAITLNTNAMATGKMLAQNGAVTFSGNILQNCTEITGGGFSCFGRLSTDPLVCSGRGNCISNNTCSCLQNVTGNNCQNFTCYSKNVTDPTVCNGKGTCVGPNNCNCLSQYNGNQCNPICYLLNSTDPSVCGGQGNCTSPNNCACNSQFAGPRCQFPICYTKLSNDSTVCSSQGNCTSPNNCSCNAQYSGAQCQILQIPVCYSKLANDSTVCSGQGNCSSSNNCSCKSQFAGPQCQFPICFSKLSNDTTVCSGQGICTSPNNCSCNVQYSGAQCQNIQIPVCYLKLANDSTVCGGQGNCTGPNNCSCNAQYTGPQCQTPSLTVCYSKLSNDSTVCGGQGNCTSTNNCVCNSQYAGALCQIPICYSKLSNDSTVCNGQGNCVSPNNCSCNSQFSGPQCQNPSATCYSKLPTDPTICSGQGTCTSLDNCTCNSQYGDSQCQSPICYSRTSTDPLVCNGRGSCSAPNTCTCNSGSTGAQCQTSVCFNKVPGDPTICSGRGVCSGPNNCTCNSQYGDSQCQSPICYSKVSSDPTVCNGQGFCSIPNFCICNSMFKGNQCQNPICYTRGSNDTNVCNGRGICSSPDTCVCASGFSGPDCQISCNNDLSLFAILSGTSITSTGATTITGDIGVYPGISVTGFPPGIVTGNQFIGTVVSQIAQTSLNQRYLQLSKIPCLTTLTGQDLGGKTLVPGVYCFSSSAQITGTLTLDARNDLKAIWIFQVGTALTTAISSKIVMVNGAAPCNVYWNIGSSASIGAMSSFSGNIFAYASVTLDTSAVVTGKVLAQNGAVTMISNTITNCPISCNTNCYGKTSNDSSVCGGRGTCSFPGYCICPSGTNGTECQTNRVNSSTHLTLSILLSLISLIFV